MLAYLKFGEGDGPNLCRVKKVDVSPTLIENYFDLVWSGPNKIDKKIVINHKKRNKQKRLLKKNLGCQILLAASNCGQLDRIRRKFEIGVHWYQFLWKYGKILLFSF